MLHPSPAACRRSMRMAGSGTNAHDLSASLHHPRRRSRNDSESRGAFRRGAEDARLHGFWSLLAARVRFCCGKSEHVRYCIDAARRTQLTAEIDSDLERTGVPFRVIELRRAQVDFQRSECRFSALDSKGEIRTLLLRILGEVDGVAEYELELDELLTAVG